MSCCSIQMEAKIIETLVVSEGSLTALEIAKKCGKKRAKDVINMLEQLRENDVVRKVKVGNKIYWKVEEEVGDTTNEPVEETSSTFCNDTNETNNKNLDTHQLIIDTLQNEVNFLRSELTAKNFHIDSLLDLVSKHGSIKSAIQEPLPNVLVNDKIFDSNANQREQTSDSLPQVEESSNIISGTMISENQNNSIDNEFQSPKKTVKLIVHQKELNSLPLSNRFGIWADCDDEQIVNVDEDLSSQPPSVNRLYSDVTNCKKFRRPSVVINQFPESESQFKSSKQSPPKLKESKPLVAVIGDSITKWCTSYDIRTHCNHARVIVKPFLGAKIIDMYDYIQPILRESPKLIVLHVLTNDISCDDFTDSDDVINNLKQLIEYIQNLGIVVVVSLPVNRCDKFSDRINNVIPKVVALCRSLLVNYVDNGNIRNTHLNGSGLHLNKDGTKLLCQNIGNFLDFLLPKVFMNKY